VDYIIAYDAACIIDREFSVYFKGVYYSKPQVVSLACERTSDLRICNYRDNNGKVVNGTTSLQEPDFSTMAMFCNAVYPKIKVADRQKANEDMSNDLVAWMLSKENRDFHPSRPDYLPPPSAKRRASEMTDAAPSNPPPPKKLAGAYKGPNYNAHHVSQQRLNVLKSRVQTSFPLKGLKFPSLILHDAILKGVDWLSGRRLINTRKNTIPGGDVGSTSRLGNVGPSSHTPSAQPSSSHGGMPGYSPAIASSSRPPPVAPSIHPSRLAMIEASQQPPLSLPFSTQYTQLQVPYPPEASNSNNNTDTLINNEDESMQAGLEGTVDSDMTPQDTSQESAEDRISLSNPNDTIENSPMEMDHVESDKSHEDSPQIEQESSNNGFNEFEEALERAHLELMRSLLGKGDEE
jgi:hypothetical protein